MSSTWSACSSISRLSWLSWRGREDGGVTGSKMASKRASKMARISRRLFLLWNQLFKDWCGNFGSPPADVACVLAGWLRVILRLQRPPSPQTLWRTSASPGRGATQQVWPQRFQGQGVGQRIARWLQGACSEESLQRGVRTPLRLIVQRCKPWQPTQ